MLTPGDLPVRANRRHLEIMRDGLRAIHDAGPGEDELAADAACGQPAAGRGGDGRYDLSGDDREWVERTAAGLGPLTDKQRDALGLLLRKHRC
jgi:hypothetical protein